MSDAILKFPDILRIEGVMAKGFGIICKYPMQDTDLDITAKAIYSLFCALAGNDHTVFPSREKILGWLGIGHSRYNSGVKQLKEQGYILVEQAKSEGSRFSHNVYTIISNPKKFSEQWIESDGGELTFSFTGLKSSGYGMLPRMVMFDQRLSCTAKVIYAYLASYSGSGNVAFPKTEVIRRHLGLSKDTLFKHLRQLVETNYVTRKQRHINGRLASNSYHLNDCPDLAAADTTHSVITQIQCPKNRPAVQCPKNQPPEYQPPKLQLPADQLPRIQSPADQLPGVQSPADQLPGIQPPADQTPSLEPTTSIRSFINSSFRITPSINSSAFWMDGMSREEIKESIREEWELALYTPEVKKHNGITISDEELNCFVDVAADFIYSRKPTLSVRGVAYTREEAISRILALSPEDCQFILAQISNVSNPIKNPRRYILSCMVTAREDVEIQAAIEVERDITRGLV